MNAGQECDDTGQGDRGRGPTSWLPDRVDRRRWWVLAALIVVGLATAGLLWTRQTGLAPGWAVGPVTGCTQTPAFAAARGFDARAAISTNDPTVPGLVLLDPNHPDHRYLHPTWDDAGPMGPLARDGAGNLYAAAWPRDNGADVPARVLNTVYRVDGQSAEMRPFVVLPVPPGTGQASPHGIVGLAFDCDTNSLYVTTVAGSGPTEEIGHIYRVAVDDATIAADLPGVDALGVAVFNGAAGKRLYLGRARQAAIQSVALDWRGDFRGAPRREELGVPDNSRAHRITFSQDEDGFIMRVMAMPFVFAFGQRAASEERATYGLYRYDPSRGWFDPQVRLLGR